MTDTIEDIRQTFATFHQVFPQGNTQGMLEIVGASFFANEPTIFGKPNDDYIKRELAWYESQSLSVYDLDGTPAIWKMTADEDGQINSNYGYLVFSEENGSQYDRVLHELTQNPNSRRGSMIYTRPTMHIEATANGRDDFVCTHAVNYFIRSGTLCAVVQMRSNDVVYGYRNDWQWQQYVLERLADDLGVEPGDMVWQAASLHVYPRHWHLIEKYANNESVR